MKSIEDGLKILGLDKREIKVMLGLSTCNTVSVSGLARLIRIPRTTVIYILYQLEERGFVEQVGVQNHEEWRMSQFSVFREKLKVALRVFEERV